MINIVVDARKLGDGGIGVYLQNLIDGMLAKPGQVRLNLLISLAAMDLLEGRRKAEGHELSVAEDLRRWADRVLYRGEEAGKYSIAEYLLLAHRQRDLLLKADLFHSPHYTLPFLLGVPAVVTIHDLIHLSHPESGLHSLVGARLIRSAVSRARAIITVSRTSRDEIEKHFPEAAPKLAVVPNALRTEFIDFGQRHTLPLPERYCLFVGSDRPHKNFIALVEALKLFNDGRFAPLTLVVVGGRFSDESKMFCRSCGIEALFFEAIDSAGLGEAYQRAAVVLVPSLIEGFGLVALEALAFGVPVICSPAPSLKEVCGDCAWYSDGFGPAQFASVLRDLEARPDERARKAEAGRTHARTFSIERAAIDTLKVYEQATGSILQ